MPHVDFFFLQCHLYLCRQFQQSQVVGYCRATLPHSLRHFLLSHPVAFEQMLVGKGYLNRVEVFALYILHERHLHHVLVVDGADICWYCRQSCYLRCTPTALTGNNLESVFCYLSQRYRLDNTYLAYACCKFLHCLFVEIASWLIGVCLNLRNRYLVYCRRPACANRRSVNQCIQSSPQCRTTVRRVVFLSNSHKSLLLFS